MDLPPRSTVTPKAAAEVLWTCGQGGCRPGAFHQRLIDAITVATSDSRELLRLGFPAYVAAVELAKGDGGVDALTRAASEV
jgi:hypothetical protein